MLRLMSRLCEKRGGGAALKWGGLRLGYVLVGLCLCACTHAGMLHEEHFVAPERFSWRSPEPPLWKLTENRRGPFQTRVLYHASEKDADLFVHAMPLPRGAEQLPLEVLAELQFMQVLGQRGGLPMLDHELRIVLDEREAVGLVGTRYDRPLEEDCALIITRSQGYLVRVGYCAPPAHFEGLASAFEQLLRHFKLLLPGPFDPMVLESTSPGAPGPSPGSWRGPRRPTAPSTPISKEESRRF